MYAVCGQAAERFDLESMPAGSRIVNVASGAHKVGNVERETGFGMEFEVPH